MIEATREENDKMMRIEFYSSMPKEVKKSSFQAFGVEISSLEEVDVAFMRIHHMKRYADHIMVGYRFRKEGEIVQGAVNDKEYYGDQEVLTAILKAQAVNVAVFVAREYSGIPLRGLCFDSIKEVSTEVLRLMSFEKVPSEVPIQSPKKQRAPRQRWYDRAGRGSETNFKDRGDTRPTQGRQGQGSAYMGSKGHGRGKHTDGNFGCPGSSNSNARACQNNFSQSQSYAHKAANGSFKVHRNNQDQSSSSSASDID